MTAAPVVTFTGQSLTTISDDALLQLLLRTDLPRYLNDLYAGEADRRMGEITPELFVPASIEDQEATR